MRTGTAKIALKYFFVIFTIFNNIYRYISSSQVKLKAKIMI
jgi:hypothetical protein